MKTVQELIDELSLLPKDALVVLASDAEGNSYNNIDGPEGGYLSEDTEFREVDLIFPGDEDEDDEVNECLTETVVIWPL